MTKTIESGNKGSLGVKLNHDLYVISLTHWDREWRFPFQKTRMMLVEMMDGLIDLLKKRPESEYKCFHLDGQTIMLEDYVEIRPENKERIKRLVKRGRLLIGPWYTLPEENQLSGESLVRNLLFGEKVGREFGGCMDCGYLPTSWGQVSQIPQILAGFGIKSAIFYRGISADQVPGNFYIWESPDGTGVFSIRLGDLARAAFFHIVGRPVIHNRFHGDAIHQWDRGGKPLRICGSGTITPYYFCNPPMGWYPENIQAAVKEMDDDEIGVRYELPFALAMECDDSTGPFSETPRLIKAINAQATGPHRVKHTSLPDFINKAMQELDLSKLPHLRGEMRNTQREGVWTDLYPEVQAARMPLKYMNRQAEYNLQRYAEPFATMAWMLGANYPVPFLEKAWRMLLSNHAHDSIGGCGMDLVHYENEFRFKQVNILSEHILQNAFLFITNRIDTGRRDPNDVVLYVFNNLPFPRSAIVEAEVDFDVSRNVSGFVITDMEGNKVPFQPIGKRELLVPFQHPQEVPCRMRCQRWKLAVETRDVPALGYKTYIIKPSEPQRFDKSIVTGERRLENEYLAIEIKANGTFDMFGKQDGSVYRGLNLFHDQGEVGDPWVGAFPTHDRIITSEYCVADVKVVKDGPLSGAFKISVVMDLPIACSRDRKERLSKTKPVTIKSIVQLQKGERFVRIATTIDNTVKDHILRVFFPTHIQVETVQVEMPFDVVTRKIRHPDTTGWREPYRPVQPQRSFVDISDGKQGLAVLNAGNGQYEAVDSPVREIALTLLRCFRQWNSIRLAEYPDQTGSQIQGVWTFKYALYPHAGDWKKSKVMQQSRLFNLPLKAAVGGPGKGDLPLAKSFIEVGDSRIELATVKKGEWDDSLILRLVNRTGMDISTDINFGIPICSAELVDMKESESGRTLDVKDKGITIDVPAKKIFTVRLRLT